jgi:hypothetical protein
MQSPWQLYPDRATLSLPPLAATVDVLEPWQGLTHVHWAETILTPQPSVLQIDLREFIAPNRLPREVYQRLGDVVASYDASEARNIQSQIYWRAFRPFENQAAAGVEIVLSVQTHLLDSRPSLTCTSVLPLGEVLALTDAGRLEPIAIDGPQQLAIPHAELLLVRPHGATYSYAEMVPAADFAGCQLEPRGMDRLRIARQFFPERLEKGVIRRSRVAGLFLARAHDVALALDAYRALLAEPLPLTT